MKDYLVVDGYNIIYAWPEFKKLRDSGLEHARSRLVAILANYAALTGHKVTVVFDAHQVKGLAERVALVDGVDVIYTRQGETADALIERLVGDLSGRGMVYVATSDWAEQTIIFGRGAFRITPGELNDQVASARKAGEALCSQDVLTDGYLENRILEKVRAKLERWRRGKG